MDLAAIEPIYWAYNRGLEFRAAKVKATFLFPHPWLFLIDGHIRGKNLPRFHTQHSDILVIGPPASIQNYELLYRELSSKGITNYDIITKKNILSRNVAAEDDSKAFWAQRGIYAFQSSVDSDNYYFELFSLLSGYRLVVAPYLSSLVIFARSMGKEVFPLLDYSYYYYEGLPFEHPPWDYRQSAPFVRSFLDLQNCEFQVTFARSILGAGLPLDMQVAREQYLDIIRKTPRYFYLEDGIYLKAKYELPLRLLVALATGREGILRRPLVSYLNGSRSQMRAGLVCKNDWVFYSSGGRAGQTISEMPYKAGFTEPGSGASLGGYN